MCFIHRTHYSARHLSGTFEKNADSCDRPRLVEGTATLFWGVGGWVGDAISRRSCSKWGCAPSSLWAGGAVTSDWSTFEPGSCLAVAAALLWAESWVNSGQPWLILHPSRSISRYSVECGFIMIIIIARLLTVWWSLIELVGVCPTRCRPHVSGSQYDGSASIKQAVVSSHITISSLYCTPLITNHTDISEIWPLPLTIQSDPAAIGLCLPPAVTWLQINNGIIIIDIPATPPASELLQCQ